MVKERLKFYDVKAKDSFKTTKYKIVRKKHKRKRNGRMVDVVTSMAVAKSPLSGIDSYRIMGIKFSK